MATGKAAHTVIVKRRAIERMSLIISSRWSTGLVVGLSLVVVLAAASTRAQEPVESQRPLATARKPVVSLPLDLVTDVWTGDFDGMVARRRIRILTPYSRTHYFVDRGVQRGMVYDLGMKIEDELNRQLRTRPANRVHVVFVPTTQHDLYDALIGGRGDIIGSNLLVTPERAQTVDFTVPGQKDAKLILVTGPGMPGVTAGGELLARRLTLREGSIELSSTLTRIASLGASARAPMIDLVDRALNEGDLLEMVDAGLIEATVVDEVVGRFWARVLPNIALHPDVVVRDHAELAWAVRKNSPRLLSLLNPLVERNRIGTLFGNVTLQKSLAHAGTLRRIDPATRTRFADLTTIFQRYAERYELEYLLVMAQANQESGFDQGATSRTGAIGVMQVTPAAARQMAVGDVRDLEANIHAGVKYIRWLMDRQLGSAPPDVLNRSLLAFAAYNCGPACLDRLRAEAHRRGLNRDVWFNNIELIAGERVGAETVRYVSNIYKYYVAYKLAADQP